MTSNSILWKYYKVPLMFLKEEKIWLSDIILLTLLWFANWPTLISLRNCFLSKKWAEVATLFLLIQSNAWNIYWGSAANLSSQHFSLACTCFEGVIGIYISSLKWFLPMEQSLGNASASQSCSEVKVTAIWPSPGAILTISLKDMLGRSTLYLTVGKCGEDSFNSLSLNLSLPSYIIITINLITVIRHSGILVSILASHKFP